MIKKSRPKELYEPLLLEWKLSPKSKFKGDSYAPPLKEGEVRWFGRTITKFDKTFASYWEVGVQGLEKTSEKYFYLPNSNDTIRVSYYEKGLPG